MQSSTLAGSSCTRGPVAWVAVLVLALLAPTAWTHTWYVKPDGTGDTPTINDATFEADPGDTILLAPGTFTGVGNFEITNFGKAMVFLSEAGPGLAEIDCDYQGRGFTIVSGGPVVISGIYINRGDAVNEPGVGRGGGIYGGTVIDNCHVMQNNAEIGGGIYCWGPATVSHNIVAGNTASNCGAGIYSEGNASVTDNQVTLNISMGNGGGIVSGWKTPGHSGATVSHNVVWQNSAWQYGGGIECGNDVTVSHNAVTVNSAGASGGGVYCLGNALVVENSISNNGAQESGGGIYCENGDADIQRNAVCENQAANGAGIAIAEAAGFEIVENIISANVASQSGGGILCDAAYGNIVRNTICENQALHGAGIALGGGSQPDVIATIIAFNTQGPGIECLDDGHPSFPYFICCDIYGNSGGDAICGFEGTPNFSLDPQFCGIPGSRNYYLQSDSPCAPDNHTGDGECEIVGAKPVGCGTTPTRQITWGSLKDMFED